MGFKQKQFKHKKWCITLGLLGLSLVFCLLVFSLFKTKQTLGYLRQGNLTQASTAAKQLKPIPNFFSRITFKKVPLLVVWDSGLELVIDLAPVSQALTSDLNQAQLEGALFKFNPASYEQLVKFNQNLTQLLQAAQKSIILQQFLPAQMSDLAQILPTTLEFYQYFLEHDVEILTILQNNHEVRATGGFMGSVAVAQINNYYFSDFKFYDIYDLAGQITDYPPAPPGLKQFLSEGQGMKLTDANWHPDFPTSAALINSLIDQALFGQKSSQQGSVRPATTDKILLAVNLSFIEDLLDILGPVYLNDYEQIVTADNLAQLAREQRLDFFAGDQQKKQYLQALFVQLKLELTQVSFEQVLKLYALVKQEFSAKNLQLFATNNHFQQLFEQNHLAGLMTQDLEGLGLDVQQAKPLPLVFYLVESNVGINKANQRVKREVKLEFGPDPKEVRLQLVFYNNNPPLDPAIIHQIEQNPDLLMATHLDYINYQRVITLPQVELETISCAGQDQSLTKEFNQRIMQNKLKQQFKEIGFLLTVPEKKRLVCQLEFHLAQDYDAEWPLFLLKQSGVDDTTYQVTYQDQEQLLLLNQDTLVKWTD